MNDDFSDFVTRLDTIEFEQLVEQARRDIPRYAPDWTDHNPHDPGMTIVDLLAWIVDQQVYRVGHVGERHRRAFAALLGGRPGGSVPARGLVWPRRPVLAGWLVQAGLELTCREQPHLHFVLGHDVYLPPAALTRIRQTVDGVAIPAPAPGLDAGSWTLGGDAGVAGTVLTLTFDGPLGAANDDVPVALGFDLVPPPGTPAATGDRAWGPVSYAYGAGGSTPGEVEVVHDDTAGMATSGIVILRIPRRAAGPGGSELRLSFDRGFFPVSPQIRAVSINVLPVVQLDTVPSTRLGEGSSRPDHAVAFDTSDLVLPPVRSAGPLLEIKVGEELWRERADFARSGPDDPHYCVRAGRIVFGNGLNGRRPAAGAAISHTEIARCAGAAGNVRPGLSWSIPALGADGVEYGTNPRPLAGGRDVADTADLAVEAREAAGRRSALVTDDELAAAARELPGMAVARAEVLAGFDHSLPGHHVDGVRTLVVVPHQASTRPGVSRSYLPEVAARLEGRRLLGERLIVQGPVTVAVDLWLTVTTEPGRGVDDLRSTVEQALRDRLSAAGIPTAAGPWPLGRDLTVADIVHIATGVRGIVTVPAGRIAIAGSPPGPGPIPVPRDGLVVAAEIEITAHPGPPERTRP